MRIRLISALFVICITTPAFAISPPVVVPTSHGPVEATPSQCYNADGTNCLFGGGTVSVSPYTATSQGYQQVASFSTSTGFTPATGSTYCWVIASTAVRYREDNIAPTASVGVPLTAGTQLLLSVTDFTKVHFIPQTGSAVLDVDCFK